MPQLSDTMHEGKILSWRKKEGDKVSRGDALAEVATDKADLEVESFHDGVLLKILSPEGTNVKVGATIAVVGQAGESVSTTSPTPSAPLQSSKAPEKTSTAPSKLPSTANGQTAHDERQRISPLAKNLARAFNVDLTSVSGTGEGGRITKKDIEAKLGREISKDDEERAASGQAIAARPAETQRPAPARLASPAIAAGSTQPLSRMRQTIANKMVESVASIPHFYVSTKVEVTPLIKLRAALKQLPNYEGVTYTHLLLRACALALCAVPRVNASYADGQLVQPQDINIGIVTALPDGLLIPVLKNVAQLSVSDIVVEGSALIKRARAGKPKQDDLVGGTFSISNLGSGSVDSFTAIINPGQGAILAVGSITKEAIVIDDRVTVGQTMSLTLSVDHRILDGVVAAEFLTELKHLLEEPALLLA